MNVARIIWPDDLTGAESTDIEALSEAIYNVLAPIAVGRPTRLSDDEANMIADLIRRGLEVAVAPWARRTTPAIRPVLETYESAGRTYRGVVIAIRWTKQEADRRATAKRVAKQEEERRGRVAIVNAALATTAGAVGAARSPFVRIPFTGDAAAPREFRREVLGEFADPRVDVRRPVDSRELAEAQRLLGDVAALPKMTPELEARIRREFSLPRPDPGAAVDLLFEILLRVAEAFARVRDGLDVFVSFARSALRPWAFNPGGLELDVDHRPAPASVEEGPSDLELRAKLLEPY